MNYQVAEKFKSVQGEGVYAGTPMAFIRLVGCSVGKKICQHCDTDFERTLPWRGGGEFDEIELLLWAHPYTHICLTGGEPLDQELMPLIERALTRVMIHVETSGTVLPDWLLNCTSAEVLKQLWITVSPKPGWLSQMVGYYANELKVIVPGLGNGQGWPQLDDALRWADEGKIVFLQPRNGKTDIDHVNLKYVQDLLIDHPNLRLSVQMHKILKVQ